MYAPYKFLNKYPKIHKSHMKTLKSYTPNWSNITFPVTEHFLISFEALDLPAPKICKLSNSNQAQL